MLAEETKINGNDKTFKEKIDIKFGKNKYYKKNIKRQSVFTIHHYAGSINYDTNGFIEKTKNVIFPHLIELITKKSKLQLLNDLFESNQKKSKTKNKTLGKIFTSDLSKLIKAINATRPTYIRCIKPNDEKKKHVWNAKKVLNQIKSGGLFSAISIRQKGFSGRQTFQWFVKRYIWCLDRKIRNKWNNNNQYKKICQIIIDNLKDKLDTRDIQIGATKIFYRDSQLVILENVRDENLNKIFIASQKLIRCAQILKQYKILKQIRNILIDGIKEKNGEKIKNGLKLYYKHDKKEVNLFRMDEIDQAEQFINNNNKNSNNNQNGDIEDDDWKEISDDEDDIDNHQDINNHNDVNNEETKKIEKKKNMIKVCEVKIENDENFDKYRTNLSIPTMKEFDSQEITIVSSVDTEIINELQRNEKELNILIEEESKVFNQLKERIDGSWTQRFVIKRMKCKFVNILFKRRINLLHGFTMNDHLKSNELSNAYNAMCLYTYYHEKALKKMIKISTNLEKFIYYIQNMAARFIQNAINFNTQNQSDKALLLHCLSNIFCLDINDNEHNKNNNQYPENTKVIELYELIHKIRSKLYQDLEKLNDSIVRSENNINEQINKMEIFFDGINTNPLIRDSIFNFMAISKIMKKNYKKLMIPKVYLNQLSIQYIPLFQKLTKYVEHILIKFIIDWSTYNRDNFQFTREIYDNLQSKYNNNDNINSNDDNDPDSIWIEKNYRNTNTFLENEITAVNKLLNDQVVNECMVKIQDEIYTAILCQTGSGTIYFYEENTFKFLIDLCGVNGVIYNDAENTLQFNVAQGSEKKILFQNFNIYQKWKCLYLSSMING